MMVPEDVDKHEALDEERIMRAGTPPARVSEGMSLVMTAPAAMTQLSPIVMVTMSRMT